MRRGGGRGWSGARSGRRRLVSAAAVQGAQDSHGLPTKLRASGGRRAARRRRRSISRGGGGRARPPLVRGWRRRRHRPPHAHLPPARGRGRGGRRHALARGSDVVGGGGCRGGGGGRPGPPRLSEPPLPPTRLSFFFRARRVRARQPKAGHPAPAVRHQQAQPIPGQGQCGRRPHRGRQGAGRQQVERAERCLRCPVAAQEEPRARRQVAPPGQQPQAPAGRCGGDGGRPGRVRPGDVRQGDGAAVALVMRRRSQAGGRAGERRRRRRRAAPAALSSAHHLQHHGVPRPVQDDLVLRQLGQPQADQGRGRGGPGQGRGGQARHSRENECTRGRRALSLRVFLCVAPAQDCVCRVTERVWRQEWAWCMCVCVRARRALSL